MHDYDHLLSIARDFEEELSEAYWQLENNKDEIKKYKPKEYEALESWLMDAFASVQSMIDYFSSMLSLEERD